MSEDSSSYLLMGKMLERAMRENPKSVWMDTEEMQIGAPRLLFVWPSQFRITEDEREAIRTVFSELKARPGLG